MPQNISTLYRIFGLGESGADLVRNTPMAISHGIGLILAIGIIAWTINSYLRCGNMPPGPRRLPFLGNLLLIPQCLHFIPFTDWSQNYGPILFLELLGKRIVILNTFKAAEDLLDRCSHIYNSRPYSVMVVEIICGGTFMPLEVDLDRWRRWRRASHETLSSQGVKKPDCQRLTTEAAALTALRIIANPDKWEHNVELFAASAIFSAVYGWAPLEEDSPYIEAIYELASRVSTAAVPGRYLVDTFPIMKYLPEWVAGWKRDGMTYHRRLSQKFEALVAGVAEKMVADEMPTCYTSDLLQNESRHGFGRKETAWITAIVVVAGAETTSTTTVNFILAMLNYPDVLRKAQTELDAVVGRDRTPTLEDADNLPYIRAIVRETLRWRPATPLAVPHLATEDNYYEGYLIPKGTIVFGNVWAMNRDPTIYPDFDAFRPERFLDETGSAESIPPGTRRMGHAGFGFGRRVCIGVHFAEQALFIAVATMLWALDIRPPLDENGNKVVPPTDKWVDAGTVVKSAPFQCRFSPRFPGSQAILEEYLHNRPSDEI